MVEFNTTRSGQIAEYVYPGLVDAVIASGKSLVELEITGAIKTTILGVAGDAEHWTDAGDLLAAIQATANESEKKYAWASKMLSIPALNLRSYGKHKLLTTSPTNNFFGNNFRNMSHVNLADMSISTSVQEAMILNEVLSQSTMSDLSNLSSGYSSFKVPDSLVRTLNAIVSSFGYTFDNTYPVIAHEALQSGIPFTFTNINNAIKTGPSSSEAYRAMWFCTCANDFLSVTPPGIKHMLFYFNGTTDDAKYAYNAALGKPGMESLQSSSMSVMFAVPVIDDGNNQIMHYANFGGKEAVFITSDTRYLNSNDFVALRYKASNAAKVHPNGFKTATGETILPSAVPAATHGVSNSRLGTVFLPYFCPPLDDQQYLLNGIGSESVVATKGDKEVTIIKIKAVASLFATKLNKAWYQSYYTTGFGLYTPRASNIQKNVLDKWNALEFETLGICVDTSMPAVNPDVVYQTDLARDYARAREKACKENDWLSKEFVEGFTYGKVRSNIEANPRMLGAYCVTTNFTYDPYTHAGDKGGIQWSRTEGGYVRSEEGFDDQLYGINDTSRDIIINEIVGGAARNFDNATFIADFNLGPDELAALDEASATLTDGYLTERPGVRGLKMSNQYFTPEGSLSMSGYPVVQFMPSPYAETTIMRSYSDLRPVGDAIVKIINSFNADVLIPKILALK